MGGSTYLKDLRVIANRDLKDLILVDNATLCFALQLDNGIPILPFYHDRKDDELLHLLFYLKCISEAEDIRLNNREAFKLRQMCLSESNSELSSRESMVTNSFQNQSERGKSNVSTSRNLHNQNPDQALILPVVSNQILTRSFTP